MTNNDILRRLRYTFNYDDSKMIALFGLAELEVTRSQVSDWLKKEDDPAYQNCTDEQLAIFLNGLINDKRGKKEGPQPEPETLLTNNIIFRKRRDYDQKRRHPQDSHHRVGSHRNWAGV
jgi:uncharacterized protein YehS (DUF1456 family)